MTHPHPAHSDPETLHAEFKNILFGWRDTHPQGHVYVLLDPLHGMDDEDPLDLEPISARGAARTIAVVERPDLVQEPSVLPRLLQLHRADEHGYADEALVDLTFVSALERCRSVYGAYVAGWLLSTAAPEVLAAHLAQAGVLFDMRLGRERYVPLFEPHRLALLIDGEEHPGVLRRWLGPVERWLFIDCARQLRAVSGEPVAAAADRPRATLSPAQSAAHDRIGQARLVAEALDDMSIGAFAHPERTIDLALQRAASQGLRDTEDIVLHALNDIAWGPRWSAHPTAAALIAKVAADPGIGLAAEMSALQDAELDEIARACASD